MSYRIKRNGILYRTNLRITSGDNKGLTQSLNNKRFVHYLPTNLLLIAHDRVETLHYEQPKSKKLQGAHANIFYEMELRNIFHMDANPGFFSLEEHKPWPWDVEPDPFEIDWEFWRFIKHNSKLEHDRNRLRYRNNKIQLVIKKKKVTVIKEIVYPHPITPQQPDPPPPPPDERRRIDDSSRDSSDNSPGLYDPIYWGDPDESYGNSGAGLYTGNGWIPLDLWSSGGKQKSPRLP